MPEQGRPRKALLPDPRRDRLFLQSVDQPLLADLLRSRDYGLRALKLICDLWDGFGLLSAWNNKLKTGRGFFEFEHILGHLDAFQPCALSRIETR